MLVPCGSCMGAIESTAPSVYCSGICDRRFHPDCINIESDLYKYLNVISGLSWKCSDCTRKCFSIDQAGLNKFLDVKYSEMSKSLNSMFDNLKAEISQLVKEKAKSEPVKEEQPGSSYSNILKNKTQPAIIVKPKDSNQPVSVTKSDIKSKINPIGSQFSLSKVKNIKDGGILVGCSSKEDNARFKKIAVENLSEKYDVLEIKGVQPRIKLVGLSEQYTSEEIVECVEQFVRGNNDSVNLNTECKVIKIWPTKKRANILQMVVQVDRQTYDVIMKSGGLFFGYDYCYAFDAIDILRCYNCNGFNHTSKNCKNKKSCPKCGKSDGLNHNISDCKTDKLSCVNCVQYNENEKCIEDTNHAAWDVQCPCYLRAVEKFKTDLFSRQ